ncbi:MAG: MFS transporter, partial [Achromobacter sp.]|nr:MFS transporter [Achromobacter sp.]
LPVWRAEFGLDYVALALLRGLYAGAMAALQVPASWLADRMGGRAVLILGTLIAAAGYGLAGFSGGALGLCAALFLAGAGSSVQHPIASSAVSRAYGKAARGPLGAITARAASMAQAAPAVAASQVPAVSGQPLSNENRPRRAAKLVGSISWRKPRTGQTEGRMSSSALVGSSASQSCQARARKST